MAVQEITSSKNVIDNSFQYGNITNEKARIGFTVEATMSDIDELFYEEYFILSGPAASALDLAGFEISDIEYDFIIHTTLHEMLEKHGLLSDTLWITFLSTSLTSIIYFMDHEKEMSIKMSWIRIKKVASTHKVTFVVVMFLNQLLFFDLCMDNKSKWKNIWI